MTPVPEQAGRHLRLPLDAAARAGWQERLGAMAILDHLGAELDLDHSHAVRLRLVRQGPAHRGGLGTDALNGAIIAGLIDCAMSVSGILHFRGRTCGTVQMSLQFMKPVRAAQPLVECYAVRKAPGMVFLEANLLDESGRSCVAATGMVGVASLRNASQAGAQQANWLAPQGRVAAQAERSLGVQRDKRASAAGNDVPVLGAPAA